MITYKHTPEGHFKEMSVTTPGARVLHKGRRLGTVLKASDSREIMRVRFDDTLYKDDQDYIPVFIKDLTLAE